MLRTILGASSLLAMPALLFGSDGYEPAPIEMIANWMAILYSVVFVAAICVVTFKNAKRTHLD